MEYRAPDTRRFRYADETASFRADPKWVGLLISVDIPERSVLLNTRPDTGARQVEMGRILGIEDEGAIRMLKYHGVQLEKRRQAQYRNNLFVLCGTTVFLFGLLPYALTSLPLLFPPDPLGGPALPWWSPIHLLTGLRFFAVSATITLLCLLVPMTAMKRIATVLTDLPFAPSLCVEEVLTLLVLLGREEALERPDRKSLLLRPMGRLARSTQLLPAHFLRDELPGQGRVREHFRQMVRYLWEREGWVITPEGTTLTDLRRDFAEMADLYIFGYYGRFAWPEGAAPAAVTPGWRERLTSGLPRVLGFVLAAAAMVYLLRHPGAAHAMGIQPSVLALILIAWLLLGVDAGLKLGIVDRLAAVTKGIRDLR